MSFGNVAGKTLQANIAVKIFVKVNFTTDVHYLQRPPKLCASFRSEKTGY
jgi:hypothetical protein